MRNQIITTSPSFIKIRLWLPTIYWLICSVLAYTWCIFTITNPMPCEKCTKIQFWCTVLLIFSLTGWSQMLFFSHLEEGFPSPPPLVRHATHLQYLHRRGSLLIHSTSIGEARYSSAVPPSVRHVTHLQHLHRWGMLLTCSASIGEARYSPAVPPLVRHVTHLQDIQVHLLLFHLDLFYIMINLSCLFAY